MRRYAIIDWIAWGLTTIGALNWGLKGTSDRNLVEAIAGRSSFERVVYALVGLAGLWSIYRFFQVGLGEPTVRERIETAADKVRRAA